MQADVMDPARARAMQAALGKAQTLAAGDMLPPFFHQLYFWDAQQPDALGRDGHPQVGGIIPDMGLPRRMWAGGRLEFHGPVRLGRGAERHSVCVAAERKDGRSGPLAFVTLRHEIIQDGVVRVVEHQDLVYREAARPGASRPVAPVCRAGGTCVRKVAFDSTMLFRYSALTFNGHRIHYDEDYARRVEGYDGLVVHGPLLAQLLMLEAAPMQHFAFRATAPLMHHETAEIWRHGSDMWVRAPDGRQCMMATVD